MNKSICTYNHYTVDKLLLRIYSVTHTDIFVFITKTYTEDEIN